jgi:thioredoxin reductase (NADPH)
MRGRHVCVVGAGNAAGQAAAHLARYADAVTLLVRGDSLSTSMSDYLIAEVGAMRNVSVRLGVEVVDGEGDERLVSVLVRDRASGTVHRIPTAGLFVMIGAEPHTDWLDGTVERDREGFILTGEDLGPGELAPVLLESSVPGVFAAGDVRHASIKRVTTAMGEGATVVHLIHRYLNAARRRSQAPRATAA